MATQDAITSRPKRQKINNQNVHSTMHLILCFHKEWGCFRIGISMKLNERAEELLLNGFEILEKRNMVDARVAKSKILNFIKFMGIQTGEDLFENQFEGWNDCWHKDDFAVKGIDHLIDLGNRCDAYLKSGKDGTKEKKPSNSAVANGNSRYRCGLPPIKDWAVDFCRSGKVGRPLAVYCAKLVGYTDEDIKAASKKVEKN